MSVSTETSTKLTEGLETTTDEVTEAGHSNGFRTLVEDLRDGAAKEAAPGAVNSYDPFEPIESTSVGDTSSTIPNPDPAQAPQPSTTGDVPILADNTVEARLKNALDLPGPGQVPPPTTLVGDVVILADSSYDLFGIPVGTTSKSTSNTGPSPEPQPKTVEEQFSNGMEKAIDKLNSKKPNPTPTEERMAKAEAKIAELETQAHKHMLAEYDQGSLLDGLEGMPPYIKLQNEELTRDIAQKRIDNEKDPVKKQELALAELERRLNRVEGILEKETNPEPYAGQSRLDRLEERLGIGQKPEEKAELKTGPAQSPQLPTAAEEAGKEGGKVAKVGIAAITTGPAQAPQPTTPIGDDVRLLNALDNLDPAPAPQPTPFHAQSMNVLDNLKNTGPAPTPTEERMTKAKATIAELEAQSLKKLDVMPDAEPNAEEEEDDFINDGPPNSK